ncbi:hypothetical protein D1007_25483 [Hordeum vulgare]|nr:hypothetical protein D1007_25483 [Hordeum vulgare]
MVLQGFFSVDWNSVELNDPTGLVIAPMDDTEMAKKFGIPVDDEDKEEKDGESSMPTDTDATRVRTEDVDGQLMQDAADYVDDAHDDELVNVYDKENPIIAVGKLFPNMEEFRMCFKTYAVKHEFDAKTKWTDRKKFYARCTGFDGSVKPCKWRKRADIPADVVQAEPILNLELPTKDIPCNVVPTEPILEVLLPTPDDIGSDYTATIVVENKAPVPHSQVKKMKSLSELGVVQSKTSIAKKRKKLSGRRKQK